MKEILKEKKEFLKSDEAAKELKLHELDPVAGGFGNDLLGDDRPSDLDDGYNVSKGGGYDDRGKRTDIVNRVKPSGVKY